ncbi:O-antigen ligase-like protein [Candidatus Magnetoovum chiemensis]|nr:O-antigen ligase-like protein [Candidatus Magnetoovum chiemensis]
MDVKSFHRIGITEKLAAAFVAFCVYVFILLMFAGKFSTVKSFAFYLPLGFWILWAFYRQELGFNWKEPVFICLNVLSLSGMLSCFANMDYISAIIMFKKSYLKLIALYAVISTIFFDIDRLKRLTNIMAYVGVLYLISAFIYILKSLIELGSIDYMAVRYYATILLYFIPFIFYKYVNAEDVRKRYWLIASTLSVLALFIISVRGSLLGLAGVAAVWMWFMKDSFSIRRTIIVRIVPVFISLVIIVFLVFPSQYHLVKGHLFAMIQISLRLEVWSNFLLMSKERLIIGRGLDDDAMVHDYNEYFYSINKRYPSVTEPLDPTSPHNQFIKILYQQGIVGFLSYLALIFLIIYRVGARIGRFNTKRYSTIGITLVSALVGEFVIRTLFEDRSLLHFGVLTAMAGAYIALIKENVSS